MTCVELHLFASIHLRGSFCSRGSSWEHDLGSDGGPSCRTHRSINPPLTIRVRNDFIYTKLLLHSHRGEHQAEDTACRVAIRRTSCMALIVSHVCRYLVATSSKLRSPRVHIINNYCVNTLGVWIEQQPIQPEIRKEQPNHNTTNCLAAPETGPNPRIDKIHLT
jgi:hypothetical protein